MLTEFPGGLVIHRWCPKIDQFAIFYPYWKITRWTIHSSRPTEPSRHTGHERGGNQR